MSISENIFALTDQMFYVSDFSVIRKPVIPPCDFVCSYNSVLYGRFFYVVKGTIIFDDERHKNLSFSAGDIIYLPAHTVYRSRWDTKEEGYFISLNFIISDSNRNIINLADDTEFPVDGDFVTIGRAKGSNIEIPAPYVSRNQAEIFKSKNKWYIENMGTTTRTMLNGEYLNRVTPLYDGDVIRIGDFEFLFEL